MVDNKNKTKAAMMQELESIKGLLLEDDEIPILQEVFANESKSGQNHKAAQAPMSRQHLEALHDQFEALGQSIAGKHTDLEHPDTQAPRNASSLLDAFTRVSPPQTAKAPQPAHVPKQQPSLFQDDTPGIDESSRNDNSTQRPALAKASGENPFLPQHIRARLHGNNPPPMFDYAASTNVSHNASTKPIQNAANSKTNLLLDPTRSSEQKDSPLLATKQQLIKEVIATVMPQLEKELRQKLEQMSQQELEKLRGSDA